MDLHGVHIVRRWLRLY